MRKLVVILLTLLMLVGCNGKTSDALKFKQEYESLNGKSNDNGLEYFKVNISKDNKVIYLNDSKEVINALTHGTKVIYFGFNTCPWCRQLVPILLEKIQEYVGLKIYYYDFKNLRNNYVSKEKSDLVKDYEEIMSIIGEFNQYQFNPIENVSKLMAPTLVFVKNGEVIGIHVGTTDDHENGYLVLTDEQKELLNDILTSYLNALIDDSTIGCHEC